MNLNLGPYVNKFVDDLPPLKQTNKIDLVLDGGAFNGSYLIGVIYYLIELENRKYINIKRISASSIGSFIAVAYMGNCLDLCSSILYSIAHKQFKYKQNLNIFTEIFQVLTTHLPKDIHITMTNRVFISYYNIKIGKKIIKSKYKNVKDVIKTIRKSCSLPFIIDNKLSYKNKYIDGMNPYIFPITHNKQVLFVNLLSYDKLIYTINIKHEKNNHHRIFTGLLDIHSFFLKGYPTSMCSYVNNWTTIDHAYYMMRYILERITYYILTICGPLISSCSPTIFSKIFIQIYKTIIIEYYL